MFNRKKKIQDTARLLSDLSSSRAHLTTLKEIFIRKSVECETKFPGENNVYPETVRKTQELIDSLGNHSDAIMESKFYQKNKAAILKLW